MLTAGEFRRTCIRRTRPRRGSDAAVGSTRYAACQILVEAIRRVGSLDRAKLRDAISKIFSKFYVVLGRTSRF